MGSPLAVLRDSSQDRSRERKLQKHVRAKGGKVEESAMTSARKQGLEKSYKNAKTNTHRGRSQSLQRKAVHMITKASGS